MHARARLHQAVHFERMRKRAVGQRRERRMHFLHGAEYGALAAAAILFSVTDDDLAPRQRRSIRAGPDRVYHARLRALDDVARYAVILKFGCEFGQGLRCGGHKSSYTF